MRSCIPIAIPILVGLCIVSCGNPDDPVSPNQNRYLSTTKVDTIKQEAVIDTSDLYYLPEDTGGTHRAYPLGTTEARFGHYVYTPGGYTDDGPAYPLLVCLHGAGERGDSSKDEEVLDDVLTGGPPRLIRSGQWDPAYPFIVVSPQLTGLGLWPPDQIHDFIEYIIDHYRVNTGRIYLTGFSLGGGGCWLYAGSIENHYAAAIVPISASGGETLIDKLRRVPVWAFHGADDDLVDAYDNFGSVQMVQLINRTNPPIRAKVTVYPNVAHNAWRITYNGDGMNRRYSYDNYNMNLYEWMLQYRRDRD